MSNNMRAARLQKELLMLEKEPPPGVSCWPKSEDQICELEAVIQGPDSTPYEKGNFKLEISVPERYPLDPPKVRFATRIYHPNIDTAGRICLSILVVGGDKGQWKPAINISTVLTSIRVLLSHPNPDDGLVAEISIEYKNNYAQFAETAREWTKKFAMLVDNPVNNSNTSVPANDNKVIDSNNKAIDNNKIDKKEEPMSVQKQKIQKQAMVDSDSDNDFFDDDDFSDNSNNNKNDHKSDISESNSEKKTAKSIKEKITTKKSPLKEEKELTPTKEKAIENCHSNSPKASETSPKPSSISLFGNNSKKPAEPKKKMSLSLKKDT